MSIKITNVEYIYSPNTPFEVHALKDINLHIDSGSYVAVIGQTGSGKSTFIQHLNGLILPTAGQVTVNNLDIKDKKQRRKIRKEVGIVFQYPEHQLFEETVFKDIAFGPTNLGFSEEQIKEAVFKSLKAVGLGEELLDKSPFDLSGGQMRRVAIAGVLAMEPKILVLDEPTAGLDPRARQAILKMIYRLQRTRKLSIILVTHDMIAAASFAERILVMHQGRVVLDGSPSEVFSHADELRKIGLAVPPVTLLCHNLKQSGFDIPDVILTAEQALAAILKNLEVKEHVN